MAGIAGLLEESNEFVPSRAGWVVQGTSNAKSIVIRFNWSQFVKVE